MSKVIICGGRHTRLTASDEAYLDELRATLPITEVVSGHAPGADTDAEYWARRRGIPVKEFPALWDDLTAPGAVIKKTYFGKPYNCRAGIDRNEQMAQYAAACIAFPGRNGTKDMMERALAHKLQLIVVVRE